MEDWLKCQTSPLKYRPNPKKNICQRMRIVKHTKRCLVGVIMTTNKPYEDYYAYHVMSLTISELFSHQLSSRRALILWKQPVCRPNAEL